MIDNNGFGYTVTCDKCDDTKDFDVEHFMAAVNATKDDGWKIFKHKGEWTHHCPSCSAPGAEFE